MSDRNRFDRDFLDSVPGSRRNFLKKMAAVAFAAPVVSSFAMDSVARADDRHRYGNQTYGNQTDCGPGQTFPNMTYGNMTFPRPPKFPGGYFGNQTFPPIFNHWIR